MNDVTSTESVKILNRAGVFLICIGCLFTTQVVVAESPGRIPERLTSRWLPPQQEDYHDFITLLEKLSPTAKKYKKVEAEETLSSIKKLLNQKKISPATRAGLMLRLAQLYNEKSLSERRKEIMQFRKKYDFWLDSENANPDDSPEPDLSTSQTYTRRAIQAYRDLFNEFPKFNNDPQLIYNMANMQLLANSPNSSLYFEKILKEAGKTVWAQRSALGLGEFHFHDKNFRKAHNFYSMATRGKNPGIIQFAQYKMAWIFAIQAFQKNGQINKAAYQKAETVLRKIASGSSGGKGTFGSSQARRLLKNNAVNDLVWLWSESFNLRSPGTFFLNVIKDSAAWFNTVERVGWKYEVKNQVQKAANTYHLLFTKAPGRTNHIRIQLRLIELLHKNDKPLMVLKEVQDLTKTISNKKGRWLKKHFKNTNFQKKIRSKVHNLMTTKSVYYHDKYRATKGLPYLQVTNVFYALYLFLFPDGIQANTVRFNYAITLEALKRYEEAVVQYHLVAKSPKSIQEQRNIASEKMIALQLAVVKNMRKQVIAKPGTIRSPLKIPPQKLMLIKVIDTYTSFYAAKPKSTFLRYTAAQIMFDYGHYKNALQRYQATVQNGPASNESRQSVKTVLQYFEFKRDWFALTTWAEKFIKFEQHLGKEIAVFIIQKLRAGMWNIALHYQKTKKLQKSAVAFLAYQKRLPNDSRADQALYNAMSLYFGTGNGKKGIEIGTKLLKLYPKSPYGANTLFSIGQAFQSLNQYRLAAESFESFAGKYPGDKRAPGVLYQASQIYRGLKNLDRGTLLLEQISSKYPNAKIAPKALLEAAEIHLKLDQYNKAALAFKTYTTRYGKINVETTLYTQAQVAILTTPNTPSSINNPELVRLENILKKRPRTFASKTRDALGKFYLDLTHNLTIDFRQQKVAYYDFNEYESSIKNYMNHLKQLELFFNRLIAIAGVQGLTEAYFKLGLIYERAMESFSEKWNMDGLRQDEAQDILDAKERIMLKIRASMEKAFQNSYENARNNKVFTPFRNQALKKLSKLRPGQYKMMKEDVAGSAESGK